MVEEAQLAKPVWLQNYISENYPHPSPPSIAPFPKHFCQEKKIEEFSSDNKNCPRGRKGGSRSIESAEQTKDKMIIFLENWWAAHPSCFANVKIQTSRLIGGLTWKLAWPGLTDPRHPIQIALQAKPFELRIERVNLQIGTYKSRSKQRWTWKSMERFVRELLLAS